jgi:hypothetical protein
MVFLFLRVEVTYGAPKSPPVLSMQEAIERNSFHENGAIGKQKPV